jgi:hypothetical protein
VSSIGPDDSGGEADGSQEISGDLVVTRRDGAELFEFPEEILDEVARLIKLSVKVGRLTRFGGGGITAGRFYHPKTVISLDAKVFSGDFKAFGGGGLR